MRSLNQRSINNFYRILRYQRFTTISEERKVELDALVEKWRYFFQNQTSGKQALMTYVAEKLTVSSKSIGLVNGDESAYFYVKMVDPELKFLEAYEMANKKEEIKQICEMNFGFYDMALIKLEYFLNLHFMEYEKDDLWTRESLKR